VAEVRGTRPAAEKAARDRLAGLLIGAAGELGVAIAQRAAAGAGVAQAEERAREHVRRAHDEAERVIADAREAVSAAEEEYRRAHEAAVQAGWAPAALADMGYEPPPKWGRQQTAPRGAKQTGHRVDERTTGETRVA